MAKYDHLREDFAEINGANGPTNVKLRHTLKITSVAMLTRESEKLCWLLTTKPRTVL